MANAVAESISKVANGGDSQSEANASATAIGKAVAKAAVETEVFRCCIEMDCAHSFVSMA